MQGSLAAAQARFWQLKRLGMFAGLEAAEVRRLVEHAATRLVAAGGRIYAQGEPARHLYVLRSGKVKITRSCSRGRKLILHLAGPGELFGEGALVAGGRRQQTATALEDAFICSLELRHVEACMRRHPEITLQMARAVRLREERAERRLLDIVCKDVRTRVAHTLAALAADHGEPVHGRVRLDLALTRTDLAQLVGSTRESTSTAFNELRRDGLVDSAGKTIWLLDAGRLAEYPRRRGIGGKAA